MISRCCSIEKLIRIARDGFVDTKVDTHNVVVGVIVFELMYAKITLGMKIEYVCVCSLYSHQPCEC